MQLELLLPAILLSTILAILVSVYPAIKATRLDWPLQRNLEVGIVMSNLIVYPYGKIFIGVILMKQKS